MILQQRILVKAAEAAGGYTVDEHAFSRHTQVLLSHNRMSRSGQIKYEDLTLF